MTTCVAGTASIAEGAPGWPKLRGILAAAMLASLAACAQQAPVEVTKGFDQSLASGDFAAAGNIAAAQARPTPEGRGTELQ